MTKEEILEDLNPGDNVQLKTKDGDAYAGQIIDFGETGLKLVINGSGKRILYETIIEYDIQTISAPAMSESDELKKINFTKDDFVIDDKAVIERNREKLSEEEDKAYISEKNRLDYAKKNHDFNKKSGKVKTALYNLIEFGKKNSAFYAFYGLLLWELGEREQAVASFLTAGEYGAAFKGSFPFQDQLKAQNVALQAVENGQADESISRWLCQRAIETENTGIIAKLAQKLVPGHEQALLNWVKAHKGSGSTLSTEDALANLKKQLFLEGNAAEAPIPAESPQKDMKNKSVGREGHIVFYNKEKRFGWIRPHDYQDENVFFYIAQVKDQELQRLLEEEELQRYPVYFKLGENGYGKPAGDAIELTEDRKKNDSLIESEPRRGYLEMTGDDYGKIYDEKNRAYSFLLKDVIDPFLRADVAASFGDKEFEVIFSLKEYKGKNVACSIRACKKYSENEIERFIKMRFLTQDEIDRQLGKEKKKNVFLPEPYVPLKAWTGPQALKPKSSLSISQPEISVKEKAGKQIPSAGNLAPNAWPDNEECIRRAYNLVVDSSLANSFASLPPLPRAMYYEKGHSSLEGYKTVTGITVGKDLDKAEELLIKAIQSGDNVSSAVGDLVSVYLQQDINSVIKGLQLIDAYGHMIYPQDKLLNILHSLIDKSGNDEAKIYILMAMIRSNSRPAPLLQYRGRLAEIYSKCKLYSEAYAQFVECRLILSKNKSVFTNYNKQNGWFLKRMAMLQWLMNNKGKARALANEATLYLTDDDILREIINGGYNPDAAPLLEAEAVESGFSMVSNTGISKFLIERLKQIDLASILKFKEIINKVKDGKYFGSPEEAIKTVNRIYQEIFRDPKQSRVFGVEQRSLLLFALARVISDAGGGTEIPSASCPYIGRAARFLGDLWVNKAINIDSVRFIYIQAINHMSDMDYGNISAALNMLNSSFFLPDMELARELQTLNIHSQIILKEDNYKLACKSIKDFLLTTFMLKSTKCTKIILESIYKYPNLRENFLNQINKISMSAISEKNLFNFKQKWDIAKKQYGIFISKLRQEINGAVEEVNMSEGLQRHTQEIKRLLDQKLLWNLDERHLIDFAALLEKISNARECYKVDEKISRYREIAVDIDNLKEYIEQLPTALGYDNLLGALEKIESAIRQQLDSVYQSSTPVCSVSLSHGSAFVNDKITTLVISIANEDNKQTADAMEIELEFSDGVKLLERNSIISVRGGEEKELLAKVELDARVLAAKQFDFTIKYSYKYSIGTDKKQDAVPQEHTLTANLLDKENFIPIDNKYHRISRGSGAAKNNKELFKGRDELIQSICASLSNADGLMTRNRGILLWGQKRVGKNSVKDLLKDNIAATYPEAYIIIDLGSIGKGNTLDDFLQLIVDKTELVLMKNYPDLYAKLLENGVDFDTGVIEGSKAMSAFSRFMDRFSSALQKLSPPETNIPLYCIDEFSYLYERIENGELNGTQFMRFWKSFIQDYNICALIIAQDNIPVWKSHYENEFACMNYDNEITYLDEKGALDLIRQPCSRDNIELFSQDAANLIYDLTRGSAFLIVILCERIIDYLNANYFETATRSIVLTVLEDGFLNDMNGIFNNGDFHPQIQDSIYVGEKAEQINNANERLLREIAEKTIGSPQVNKKDLRFFDEENPDYANKIFNRLKERNIIKVVYNGSHIFCSIFLPLLKLSLLKESGRLTRDVIKDLTR